MSCGGDALAGDVRDDHTEVPRPVGVEQREDVEEIAADGAGRSVVVSDLPALGLDAREQDEGPLDPLGDLELALDELRFRGRGSGSLERGHGRVAVGVDREELGHAGPLEHPPDRLLRRCEPDVRGASPSWSRDISWSAPQPASGSGGVSPRMIRNAEWRANRPELAMNDSFERSRTRPRAPRSQASRTAPMTRS